MMGLVCVAVRCQVLKLDVTEPGTVVFHVILRWLRRDALCCLVQPFSCFCSVTVVGCCCCCCFDT